LAAKLRLFVEIENNYLKILCVFEFNGFHNVREGACAENLPQASCNVNPALPRGSNWNAV
jgi:hypothetical protein